MSASRNRQRAQSDVTRDSHLDAPRSPATSRANAADDEPIRSPRRAATSLDPPPVRTSQQLRRRSNATRPESFMPPRTIASRVPGPTLAGPDDSAQLRTAHEAFVHPGYAELNPSYEQANNARPVWSLAKPLPRVVRPGMVPTRQEILEASVRPELPAEASNRMGLEVDPNDLEAGKIKKSANLAKVAAQVMDSRRQREKNFLSNLQDGTLGRRTTAAGRSSRLSSQFSRPGRTSTWAPGPGGDLEPWQEEDNEGESRPVSRPPPGAAEDHQPPQPQPSPSRPPRKSGEDQHLPPVAEQPEPKSSDADSLTTVGPDAYGYPEDLQPLLDAHIEEEIHNNHTAWSVFRTHYREMLAEMTGVVIQLLLGFSAILAVTVADPSYQATTDWAFGLATMTAIYISGGISGAHLNPSITIMFWFYRGFPKRKMPAYFFAQFVGAFIAALIAYGVYLPSIQHYLATTNPTETAHTDIINSFVTSQRYPYITPASAFFTEFVGTACLVIAILALGDDQNAPPGAGMNAFIVGLVIVIESMAFGRQTGAALNPSRDFGPRLALLALGYGDQLFTNAFWFYGPWCGSLGGAFVGAFVYDGMIFTGGESPVNYPWSRVKRSFEKGRVKWERRVLRLWGKGGGEGFGDEEKAEQ